MPLYVIPIHGLIGSPEGPNDKAPYFPFDQFLLHINKAQAFDTIELDIASDGGYVDIADKMIEVLQATKKALISRNSGNVCSAASKIFTLAPKGSRFFDPTKGAFLIHNPFGMVEGTADELSDASKELQDIENSYAKWYQNATGADLNVIKAFMAENIPLTPEQIESLGFATLVKQTVNAVAKLKSNNIQMENKEVVEKISGFQKILNKILAKLKIKDIMLADVNGKELEFPDLSDAMQVAVGVKVNEGGQPANGEYTMPDGSVVVAANGLVTEIKPAAPADDTQALKDENAALKAEIETLKAGKATADTELAEAVKAVTEIKAEFTKFKAQFSKGDPGEGDPPGGDPPTNIIRKPFKVK